jgi:hypothetical protein
LSGRRRQLAVFEPHVLFEQRIVDLAQAGLDHDGEHSRPYLAIEVLLALAEPDISREARAREPPAFFAAAFEFGCVDCPSGRRAIRRYREVDRIVADQ